MRDFKKELDELNKPKPISIIKISLFVLFIIGFGYLGYKLDRWHVEKYVEQMDQIQLMKKDMATLNRNQTVIDNKLNELHKELENSIMIQLQFEEKAQEGKASYYDYQLSSGWSSKGHKVCASRDFPRGTTLAVKNIENGKVVECLVTDFGPNKEKHPDRIVDLSSFAFSQIAELHRGIVQVKVSPIN